MEGYLRGQVAKMANVNSETLRYYENHGLIPPPKRSEAGYRLYTEEVLTRLAFIHNAKRCGFTIREIKKALAKSKDGSISMADFLAVIDRKIISLNLEIAKREKTKTLLADLKTNLQSTNRHPEIQSVLHTLNMEP